MTASTVHGVNNIKQLHYMHTVRHFLLLPIFVVEFQFYDADPRTVHRQVPFSDVLSEEHLLVSSVLTFLPA
jgi:hypothetical protein